MKHTTDLDRKKAEEEIEKLTIYDIYKEALIGYVITKASEEQDDESLEYFVQIPYPIIMNWEGISNVETLLKLEKIIGLIPMVESYAVYGHNPLGSDFIIGFQLKGAYHPNWLEELKRQLREKYIKRWPDTGVLITFRT